MVVLHSHTRSMTHRFIIIWVVCGGEHLFLGLSRAAIAFATVTMRINFQIDFSVCAKRPAKFRRTSMSKSKMHVILAVSISNQKNNHEKFALHPLELWREYDFLKKVASFTFSYRSEKLANILKLKRPIRTKRHGSATIIGWLKIQTSMLAVTIID